MGLECGFMASSCEMASFISALVSGAAFRPLSVPRKESSRASLYQQVSEVRSGSCACAEHTAVDCCIEGTLLAQPTCLHQTTVQHTAARLQQEARTQNIQSNYLQESPVFDINAATMELLLVCGQVCLYVRCPGGHGHAQNALKICFRC